ncbi:MAG: ATP-binding protein [Candidatus Omnitrophota bacterium]|nr:MAG: ATP-binding protein [Candidatus Omnitrophota bacterium]
MNLFNNPVVGNKFFARERELNFLHRKVEDLKNGYRHNVAVLGKGLIGKSSLLLHFLSGLDTADVVPVYLDLSTLSFAGFVDQFIGMLLHYNYKDIENETSADLQSLINLASSDLPGTCKKIKIIYSHMKTANKERAVFQELLDLPPCFSKESGKFCLIVFDNFSKLTDYKLGEPFSILGEKIMLQKMSLYILSDRPYINLRNILSQQLSLLFGKFQMFDLEPFSPHESLAFIDSRVKDVKLSAELKDFLVYFSGGEPFYLDILTESISIKAGEKKLLVVTQKDLSRFIYECIYARFASVNQYFSRIVEKFSGNGYLKEPIKILNAVIRKNKIAAIIEDSKCSKAGIHKLLEKFIMQNMVIKNGPLYAIEDEVFKMWLRLKEIEAIPQLKLDQRAHTEKFVNEIRQLIETFEKEQQRSIDNKILNLIAAFDNEKVTVGKAAHILPVFKHIHTEYTTSQDALLSGHGTKLWIFSIFKKMAEEDDILNFIDYYKKLKHRVARKVLIILNGITPEAKLLAMKEHIWIWSSDRLNSLLNLYRKARIGTQRNAPFLKAKGEV